MAVSVHSYESIVEVSDVLTWASGSLVLPLAETGDAFVAWTLASSGPVVPSHQLKSYVGGEWVNVTAKRFSGASWVETPVVTWDGASWS